jgi:hypothetical protein
MRNPTNSSRTSMTIALSLAIVAMTLSGPALAADRENATRGAKGAVVSHQPDPATLPISGRPDVVVDRGPSFGAGTPGSAGAWKDTLVRLAFTLRSGIRF